MADRKFYVSLELKSGRRVAYFHPENTISFSGIGSFLDEKSGWHIHTKKPFTRDERHEIASAMIAAWLEWAQAGDATGG